MATLTITKTYADTTLLTEAQLDAFCDSIETFFNVTKINDDNIVAKGIDANEKFIGGSIAAAQIAANAVTTPKFAAGAVSASKINALAVTNEKLADGAVTTDKLVDADIDEDLVAASVSDEEDTASAGESSSSLIVPITLTLGATLSGGRPLLGGFIGFDDVTTINQGIRCTPSQTSTAVQSFQVAFTMTMLSSVFGSASPRLTYVAAGASGGYSAQWQIPGLGLQFVATSTAGAAAPTCVIQAAPANIVGGTITPTSAGSRSLNVKGRGFMYEL